MSRVGGSGAAGPGIVSLPAVAIARSVRERALGATDVVAAHLERIDRLESTIKAFQVVRRQEAVAEAEALSERDDLGTLPLAGVPVAVKDNIDVAGTATRHGSAATTTAPAEGDDELVVRLRAAGCVVIGKTQMPELAIWPFTEPAAFASTCNPWDHSRTPGGSTGGGAAAVASGMAALAIGSDGGGSIRVPAACCGIVGLKPGSGLVPLAGGAAQHWYGMTAFGPLGRTVADVAIALDVLAGKSTYRDPRPPERPLRIAFSVRHPAVGARAAPAVCAVFEQTVGDLRKAGHEMFSARPPYPATVAKRFVDRWLAGIAEDAAELPFEALEDRTQVMVRRGRRVARRVKPASTDPFVQRIGAWFESYDLLVTPTLTRAAVPTGTWAEKGWVRTMLGVANWIYTAPWNVAAIPAASIPARTDDGLPIGIQLVAPAGGEETILAVAAQIEQLRPWPQTAPDPQPTDVLESCAEPN
jgi:amidase